MIRLSRLTDYAVALLSHMGKGREGRLWAASELAETSGLPMPTVAKVLKLLAKQDLVAAQRGAMGGYRLMRPALAISVAAIIEAMDGPIALTHCANGESHEICDVRKICPVGVGWGKVNHAIRKALTDVSLAELGG